MLLYSGIRRHDPSTDIGLSDDQARPATQAFRQQHGADPPHQTRALFFVPIFSLVTGTSHQFFWCWPLCLPFSRCGAIPLTGYALTRSNCALPFVGEILRKIILSRFAQHFLAALIEDPSPRIDCHYPGCRWQSGSPPRTRTCRATHRRGPERHGSIPAWAVHPAGHPHAAYRRDNRGSLCRAKQRQLLL